MHVALCLWTVLKTIARSQLILTIIATCSPLSSICGTCLSKVSVFPSIFFTTALGTSFSAGSTLTASVPESKMQCLAISFPIYNFLRSVNGATTLEYTSILYLIYECACKYTNDCTRSS